MHTSTEAIISALGSWRKPYRHNIWTGKEVLTQWNYFIITESSTLWVKIIASLTWWIVFFNVHLNSDQKKYFVHHGRMPWLGISSHWTSSSAFLAYTKKHTCASLSHRVWKNCLHARPSGIKQLLATSLRRVSLTQLPVSMATASRSLQTVTLIALHIPAELPWRESLLISWSPWFQFPP